MAEQPVKGKQLARTLKPSRLRNEVHLESTDDKRTNESKIQVPNSDVIIPETQFNNTADSDRDEGMEKADRAVITQYAASNTMNASPPSPLQIKMLSREALGLETAQPASSTPAFSFEPTRQASFKTAQQTIEQAPMPNSNPPLNVNSNNTALKARLLPEFGERFKVEPFTLANKQRTHSPSHSFHTLDVSHCEPELTGPAASQFSSSVPTSAQPRLFDGSRKIRIVSSSQKGKKPTSSQPKTEVRPPRSDSHGQYSQDPSNVLPMSYKTFKLPGPSLSTQPNVRTCLVVEEDAHLAPITCPHSNDKQDEGVDVREAPADDDFQQEKNVLNTDQSITRVITSKAEAVSSQSVVLTPSSAIPIEQTPTTIPRQTSGDGLNGPIAMYLAYTTQQSSTQDSIGKPQKRNRDTSLPSNDIPSGRPITEERAQEFNAVPAMGPRSEIDDSVLHKTVKEDNSLRVSKPRKKIRVPGGSLMHLNHRPSIPSTIDQMLDQVKLKFHADEYRDQHERDQAAKHHEETTRALRELIALQSDTIAEWKEKHQDLRGSLNRLTDKAKTNQKYATGLQNDYEKLQKSAIAHHEESKKILREKIAEVEHEKQSLQREFDQTLAVLHDSQKNLKATAEDLYKGLKLSHSERRGLMETLSKQTALYDAECRKRKDLEKQLFVSIQDMKCQLSNTSTTVIDKLKDFQSSIDEVKASNGPDPQIEECLKMLRNLQATPFLTTGHVKKAEGMLRYVHERLDSGFEVLKNNTKGKHAPSDELQTFVKSQLNALRADCLNYTEVVSANLKTAEANTTLRAQLLAQEQNAQDLGSSVKEFRRKESELKAQLSQLESELNESRETLQDHEMQPIELEQKTLELRQRAEKAEDCLGAAQNKTEEAQRLTRQVEDEVAKYKNMYNACREKLLDIAKQKRYQQETAESFTEMRIRIEKEHQNKFDEKESDFKNEIHRVSIGRDEFKEKYQEQLQQAKAAKSQLHDVRNHVKTLNAHIQTAREEKDELQMKLKNAQQTAQAGLLNASELVSLKEQLQQRMKDMESLTQDHATLEREHADLRDKEVDLRRSYDQSQAQIVQHLSKIKNLREDSAKQLLDAKQRAENTVRVVQDQASSLRKEKEALSFELEQARSTQATLEETQNNISKARDMLKQDLAKLRTAKENQNLELARIHSNVAEEKRVLMESHRSEVGDMSRQLNEADTALKNAKADLRRMEAEHRAKLNSDKRTTASMFQLVREEAKKAIQEARMGTAQNQHRTIHPPPHSGISARSLQNMSVGKNKKKVNRQNQSVLIAAGSWSTEFDIARHMPSGSQLELPHAQRQASELSTNLFEEGRRNGFASEDLVDSYDLSLVDAAAETVPETQLTTGPAMTLEDFDEDLSRVTPNKTKSRGSSSTDLSIMGSEDMTQLELDTQTTVHPVICSQEFSSPSMAPTRKHRRKTSVRVEDLPVFDPRSSQPPDRPRSRANTGSRMVPSPALPDYHPTQHHPVVKSSAIKNLVQQTPYGKPSQKSGGNASSSGASSFDFMHSKHAHHDPRLLDHEQSQTASRSLEHGHSSKRKTSMNPNEPDSALKRQRTSSHLSSSNAIFDSRDKVSKPSESSSLGSRSKTKSGSTRPAGAPPVGIRLKTQLSSSQKPAHQSSERLSSSDVSQSHARTLSSPRPQVVDRSRRSSVRPAKSRKSRGGKDIYDDRFGQELGHR